MTYHALFSSHLKCEEAIWGNSSNKGMTKYSLYKRNQLDVFANTIQGKVVKKDLKILKMLTYLFKYFFQCILYILSGNTKYTLQPITNLH